MAITIRLLSELSPGKRAHSAAVQRHCSVIAACLAINSVLITFDRFIELKLFDRVAHLSLI